jgi:gamma-butyrobetaine dioxygenase
VKRVLRLHCAIRKGNFVEAGSVLVKGHRFSLMWLRDNCLCSTCRESVSFQKIVDLGRLPGPISAKRVDQDGDAVRIEWADSSGHVSTFPVSWLLAHAYDPPAPSDVEERTLWNAETWRDGGLVWHGIDGCDPDGGEWADDLARYGVTLLDKVTAESLDSFVARIGPVFETEFGRAIEIRSTPNSTDLALSGNELTVHTDFSAHMYTPALLQFMLCVEHNAEGGASILVDGFRAAEDFRVDHPGYFARLVETPVNFQQVYTDRHYFHQRTRAIIEVDDSEVVSGVYFAHSHACNWKLRPADLESFYAAYHAFFDYLKDPAYQLEIRLGAGQCVALQNGRLLHGRKEYDPNSGNRTLITEFVAWEYFEARRRYHAQKHLYLEPLLSGRRAED